MTPTDSVGQHGRSNPTAATAFDADYWVANLRNPVRFSQAVAESRGRPRHLRRSQPAPACSPTPSATRWRRCRRADRFIVTSAMKRGDDETLFFHAQLATLGVTAPDIGRRRRVGHTRVAVAASPATGSRRSRPDNGWPDVHPLLGVHVEMPSGHDHVWQADIGVETLPWLADHTMQGRAVMLGGGLRRDVVGRSREALGLRDAVRSTALEVERPLILDAATRVTTQLAQGHDVNRVEIQASSAGGSWSRYAVADIGPWIGAPAGARTGGSATEIVLPDDVADHPEYCIHPVLLDAALQQLAAAIRRGDRTETSYLPVSLATIRVFGPFGGRARATSSWSSQAQDGRRPSADRSHRRHRHPDRGDHRVELRPMDLASGAATAGRRRSSTPNGWRARRLKAMSVTPAGRWLLLAESDAGQTTALAAEIRDPVQLADSASDHRERWPMSPQCRRPSRKPGAIRSSRRWASSCFVGNRSFDGTDTDAALEPRARLDLVRSRSRRTRPSMAGQASRRGCGWSPATGLSVHDDEPGDPAIGALKGLIRNWRFPGEAARVLADEPDLGATLVDRGRRRMTSSRR